MGLLQGEKSQYMLSWFCVILFLFLFHTSPLTLFVVQTALTVNRLAWQWDNCYNFIQAHFLQLSNYLTICQENIQIIVLLSSERKSLSALILETKKLSLTSWWGHNLYLNYRKSHHVSLKANNTFWCLYTWLREASCKYPKETHYDLIKDFWKNKQTNPKTSFYLAAVTIFVTLETQKKKPHTQKSVEQFLGSITFFKSGG